MGKSYPWYRKTKRGLLRGNSGKNLWTSAVGEGLLIIRGRRKKEVGKMAEPVREVSL